MKIALCQLNPITGNIPYNLARIVEELDKAAGAGVELVIFTELAVPGYPPKDLLEYDSFIRHCQEAVVTLQEVCRRLSVSAIVGTVHPNIFGGKKALNNCAAHISAEGAVTYTYKKLLPTYDVFDEQRYFDPAPPSTVPPIFTYGEHRIGISICEDIWNDNQFWKDERLYEFDPIQALVDAGANLIVNISASPFVTGKPLRRVEMLTHTARRWNMPVIIVNQVGGQDTIVFDGGSGVFLPDGSIPCLTSWFAEETVIWDTTNHHASSRVDTLLPQAADEVTPIYRALTLGLRDYLRKTGFKQVVVGNSGGIDSAVVLALAVSALGADDVISVTMPGPYTSDATRNDAQELAHRMGIRHVLVPITGPYDQFRTLLRTENSNVLATIFGSDESKICGIADENIQARIRGNILMWISNAIAKPRTLVLSTGNKSEMAAGYCTLYGDMAGGLALISDVPKMMVYKLARFLNERMGEPIPQTIIDREPTAELAPNQKDSDSLPPYPLLDEIIRLFVEERQGTEEIIAANVADADVVRRVIRLIENSEYKRAQAAPGLKVTSKAFGFGRRIPIARG